MKLILRTVIHAHRVSISNVPVYSCESCARKEVFPGVKDDLGRLVGRLGAKPDLQRVSFDEVHELAGVLRNVLDRREPLQPSVVARRTEERMNELLDLLLIADSVGDERWKAELKGRLAQLSAQYIS